MIHWAMTIPALVAAVPQAAPADARTAIEAAMQASAAGWNAGDLDRFLAVYSDDPATSFTGAKGMVRGKAAIRARYVAVYPAIFGAKADRAAIPKLSFAVEEVRALGADHTLLTSRWRLAGADEVQTGMTTLVFRHEAGGWRIVADHSS